jgi:hypothetical protein
VLVRISAGEPVILMIFVVFLNRAGKYRDNTSIGTWPLLSKSLPINHVSINPRFTVSVLAAMLNKRLHSSINASLGFSGEIFKAFELLAINT